MSAMKGPLIILGGRFIVLGNCTLLKASLCDVYVKPCPGNARGKPKHNGKPKAVGVEKCLSLLAKDAHVGLFKGSVVGSFGIVGPNDAGPYPELMEETPP